MTEGDKKGVSVSVNAVLSTFLFPGVASVLQVVQCTFIIYFLSNMSMLKIKYFFLLFSSQIERESFIHTSIQDSTGYNEHTFIFLKFKVLYGMAG